MHCNSNQLNLCNLITLKYSSQGKNRESYYNQIYSVCIIVPVASPHIYHISLTQLLVRPFKELKAEEISQTHKSFFYATL